MANMALSGEPTGLVDKTLLQGDIEAGSADGVTAVEVLDESDNETRLADVLPIGIDFVDEATPIIDVSFRDKLTILSPESHALRSRRARRHYSDEELVSVTCSGKGEIRINGTLVQVNHPEVLGILGVFLNNPDTEFHPRDLSSSPIFDGIERSHNARQQAFTHAARAINRLNKTPLLVDEGTRTNRMYRLAPYTIVEEEDLPIGVEHPKVVRFDVPQQPAGTDGIRLDLDEESGCIWLEGDQIKVPDQVAADFISFLARTSSERFIPVEHDELRPIVEEHSEFIQELIEQGIVELVRESHDKTLLHATLQLAEDVSMRRLPPLPTLAVESPALLRRSIARVLNWETIHAVTAQNEQRTVELTIETGNRIRFRGQSHMLANTQLELFNILLKNFRRPLTATDIAREEFGETAYVDPDYQLGKAVKANMTEEINKAKAVLEKILPGLIDNDALMLNRRVLIVDNRTVDEGDDAYEPRQELQAKDEVLETMTAYIESEDPRLLQILQLVDRRAFRLALKTAIEVYNNKSTGPPKDKQPAFRSLQLILNPSIKR